MGEVQTSKKMTSRWEEKVIFDLATVNLWLLLILQELHENEHKCSLRKEILKTLRKLRKNGQRLVVTPHPLPRQMMGRHTGLGLLYLIL